MRWLVRLVTPPGGVVLDPFLGSGTTGAAAALEGFRFLGIEREPEYLEIARARVAHWAAIAATDVEPEPAPAEPAEPAAEPAAAPRAPRAVRPRAPRYGETLDLFSNREGAA